MNEILSFEGHQVRVVMQDGEPWWVVKDVCDALGVTNVTETMRRVDGEDFSMTEVLDARNCKQQTYIVNEAGLYSLILRSDKPEAKRFKRWLTHEVIPSIRKTGKYEVAKPAPTKFEIMRNMLDAWEAHETKLEQHDKQIGTIEVSVSTLSDRMDLFGADTHYRTVRAFGNERKLRLSHAKANAIGRKAAKICRDRGIEIGEVPDERHGTVHSYPIDVLQEVVDAK